MTREMDSSLCGNDCLFSLYFTFDSNQVLTNCSEKIDNEGCSKSVVLALKDNNPKSYQCS
jgi:hypothetical protein